jgi:hypothetical protein
VLVTAASLTESRARGEAVRSMLDAESPPEVIEEQYVKVYPVVALSALNCSRIDLCGGARRRFFGLQPRAVYGDDVASPFRHTGQISTSNVVQSSCPFCDPHLSIWTA